MWKQLLTIATLMIVFSSSLAQTGSRMKSSKDLPPGYWPLEKSQPIIDKTQTIRLAPDLSHLSETERKAVAKLLEVGKIFQSLYEKQRHPQAFNAYNNLVQLDKRGASPATQNLLTLYRLNQGPIATTLENKREAFLPVEQVRPGKNVYPADASKDEIEGSQSTYRQGPVLEAHPAIDELHPGLRRDLRTELLRLGPALDSDRDPREQRGDEFYATPYSVAYAEELTQAFNLLNEAADLLKKDDEEFAGYLRNRARDLLSDDYESG